MDHSKRDTSNSMCEDDDACVVCFKKIEIFSVGECEHPVCYVCSTRLRVLCRKNECPICRKDLSKVFFANERLPYADLEKNNREGLFDKKAHISFANRDIQKSFYHLQRNDCQLCDHQPSFLKFDDLKFHIQRQHERFFCDICTDHLKIFTFERRCYTRQDLATHRREGDSDDTSHRGHPLCDFCDTRFLDRDERFRHLRKEHYFCHLCDADGHNEFYNDSGSLFAHFKKDHFICTEGECAVDHLTSVFRSDVDLRSHRIYIHGKTMSKVATKQARQLEVEFSLVPRNRGQIGESSRQQQYRGRGQDEMEPIELYEPMTRQQIDAHNEREFPSLAGGPSTNVTLLRPNLSVRAKTFGSAGLARTKENFPALGSESGGEPSSGSSIQYSHGPASAVLRKPNIVASASTAAASSRPNSMVIHVSNRPTNVKTNDYPALPGTSKNAKFHDPDPLPAYTPAVHMKNIAAKHRSMVDDFVQNKNTDLKLNIIQREENGKTRNGNGAAAKVPKLNSSELFPSLSGESRSQGSSVAQPPQWIVQKTQRSKVKQMVAAHPNNNNNNFSEPKAKKTEQPVAKVNAITNATTKKEKKPQASKKDTAAESSKAAKQPVESKKSKTNSNQQNGNTERKISELKIENLNINNKENKNSNQSKEDKNNGSSNDFPLLGAAALATALHPNWTKMTKVAPPPGFQSVTAAPPPGFNNNQRANPPPGLNSIALNSVARSNLTFTTSMGQSYNILPDYQYTSPPNALKRSQVLVSNFQNLLKPEAVDAFRTVSKMFRDGSYNAMPYYEHCQCALGDRFDDVFPELLALLPVIGKQQELYLVYKQCQASKKGKSSKERLQVCTTCKQVLLSEDLIAHSQVHTIENNFPSLANTKTPQMKLSNNNSWKK